MFKQLNNYCSFMCKVSNMLLAVIKSCIRIKDKHPPVFIPIRLLGGYTLNGKVKIKYWYSNDSYSRSQPKVFKRIEIDYLLEKIKKKDIFYYGQTDAWLYQALSKYSIKEQNVAVIGSVFPLYESICISYGGRVTTIEYNKIISEDKRLQTLTVEEYDRHPVKFDAVFSISSFEHDGLGRYGDPINPDGDLLAMEKMKTILKPGGLLFLAVPIGKDTIVWNIHRIYGNLRLPMLLAGWQILERFGFDKKLLNYSKSNYQPVFVLRNLSN